MQKSIFPKGVDPSVEDIFQHLLQQLQKQTQSSDQNCRQLARRIIEEVTRICRESERIQQSGDIQGAAQKLVDSRLNKCLFYYWLGATQGRVELHSTLSAIIYRYISLKQGGATYHVRVTLIEDFLQGFYIEALNTFRKETSLEPTYCPRTPLEIAEYLSFCERYGKRRIPLGRGRSQQLIILRAQTFSKQYPGEALVDMDLAAQGGTSSTEETRADPIMQDLQKMMAQQSDSGMTEDYLREIVITSLIEYLEEHDQSDCIQYFILLFQDIPTKEIEQILNINARKRDYLQQRFKYHLLKFIFSPRFWEVVHQWLGADLENNLGLSPQQQQQFLSQLNSSQTTIVKFKHQGMSLEKIALELSQGVHQVEKQWSQILKLAWEIRNRSPGAS